MSARLPRPRGRRLRAAAATIAVALLAALLPSTLATPASAAPVASPAAAPVSATDAAGTAIGAGSLSWGVRQSFHEYINDSGIAVSGGATKDPATADTLTFPIAAGRYDAARGATTLSLAGGVRYTSHCGDVPGSSADVCALDLVLDQLNLVIDPGEQTLYAHVASRPLGSGSTLPAIVDYGVIPLVNLTIDGATVASADGRTSWAGIATAISKQAAPAFLNYPAGSPFAPLSFSYEGPGGAPDFGETFTPPGTPVYGQTGNWLGTAGATIQGVHLDETRGIAYVVFDPAVPTLWPYVQAVDAKTFAPLGKYAPTGQRQTRFAGAFDPSTGTLFAPLTSTTGEVSIHALRWNSGASAFDDTTIAVLPTGSSLRANPVWNPGAGTLTALTLDATRTTALTRWASTDGWRSTSAPLTEPAGQKDGYFAPPTLNSSVAPAGDGIVLARTGYFEDSYTSVIDEPRALLIAPSGTDAVVSEIAGTGTGTTAESPVHSWNQVYAGPDGRLAFTDSDFSSAPRTQVVTGTLAGSTYTPDGDPIVLDDASSTTVSAAFDGDLLWVKDYRTGAYTGVRGGTVATRFTDQTSTTYGALAIAADHSLYTGVRTASRQPGIARIAITAVSPAVSEQPRDATVQLRDGATTGTATFHAAATGTPAPTVRWQARIPTAAGFADIPGATGDTLETAVSVDDNGTQYRAIFGNSVGELATDPAALTVQTPPTVLLAPTDVTVAAGADATFSVIPGGSPTPTVTWQRRSGGAWIDVTAADGFRLGSGSLTVPTTTAAQSGLTVRARLTNPVGTLDTGAAALTVTGGTTTAGGTKPAVAGSLSWGVKSSFRSYITGPIASGWIAVSGGASAGSSAYAFPQADGTTWTPATGTGTAAYRGAVQFYGHGGILNVTLSNPQVRIDSATAATLLVSSNGSAPNGVGTIDLARASRTDLAGGVAYANAPVTLTSAGVGVFSYGSSRFYSAGQAMDPVSFTIGAPATTTGAGGGSVTVASAAKKRTPPAEPPATTGITLHSPAAESLVAGATVTISADGFGSGEKGVRLVVYSTPRILADDLVADADGRVTWTGPLPADLTGRHTLTLQGSVNRGIVLDIAASTTAGLCTVAGATLTWGFKSSFRTYIRSAIANGDWTVDGGTMDDAGVFGWSAGAGTRNPATGAGLVGFAGTIHFTGHDGLLDTTIGAPQLQFVDDRTAYLLLDVSGDTMDGTPTDLRGASFAKLDLSAGTLTPDADGGLTATGVPAELTPDGGAAFPNYEAGTALDPVSFHLPAATECEKPAATVDEGTSSASGGDTAAPAATPTANTLSWLPWAAGGAALAALLAVALLLLVRRGRRRRDAGAEEDA